MRRSSDFGVTIRHGRRARRGSVVVHQLIRPDAGPARVGFVVSKAVGTSVVRHRVTRRLRHVVRDRLIVLPQHSNTVVRALAEAASADSSVLAADLDAALARLAGAGAGL
jgi:ribonuclease P protein component